MDIKDTTALVDKISQTLIRNDPGAVFHSNGKDNPQRVNEMRPNQLDFLKEKTAQTITPELQNTGMDKFIDKISQSLIKNDPNAVFHSNGKDNPQRTNNQNIQLNNQLNFLKKKTPIQEKKNPIQAKADLIKEAQKLGKLAKAFVASPGQASHQSLPQNKRNKGISSGRG